MEAATLKKKKTTISKGKLKKTIKNVLCRPDELFWPEVSEEERLRLESALKIHKIDIPEYTKPHWKVLKDIPKDKRPKPPKLKKVNGLLLGIRECKESLQAGKCSAIILESNVNPRLIVQPLIDICTNKDIPLLCLPELRQISSINFGIPTSCLGIISEYLPDLNNEIVDIAKKYKKVCNQTKETTQIDEQRDDKKIDQLNKTVIQTFTLLHRSNKKSRVFIPNNECQENRIKQKIFAGQNFIEFSGKSKEKDSKAYMKMLLKRISNNPDRVKINK